MKEKEKDVVELIALVKSLRQELQAKDIRIS